MFLMFNSQVFPSYVTRERAVTKQSALARFAGEVGGKAGVNCVEAVGSKYYLE